MAMMLSINIIKHTVQSGKLYVLCNFTQKRVLQMFSKFPSSLFIFFTDLFVFVLQVTSKHEPFPRWLVDLMVNIEEATTHQLVVE